ncbi:MAG: methyltransferase [Candidatus Parcubacteria bacterium]|nr:MAG: methyltransferase [Bacteroidia bacterium]GIW67789.1 MAG: methyltransferase [Candidatus Parcubacteria bacterium]
MNWKEKFPKENRYFETDNGILYCGDCLEILPKFPEMEIDLVLTDPPYGINFNSNVPKKGREKELIKNDDSIDTLLKLFNESLKNLTRILKDDAEIYWFCSAGGRVSPYAYLAIELEKYYPIFKHKNLLVWDKLSPGFGWDWRYQHELIIQIVKGKGIKNTDSGASNIIRAKKVIPQMDEHPTPKSTNVINQILIRKPSDVVLDMFLGSGTTAFCCEKSNRKWIGIEIEPKYCEMAKKRIESEAKQLKLNL